MTFVDPTFAQWFNDNVGIGNIPATGQVVADPVVPLRVIQMAAFIALNGLRAPQNNLVWTNGAAGAFNSAQLILLKIVIAAAAIAVIS